MNPYYKSENVRLYAGDALRVLQTFPDASVQTCVTSPPYYGLRDYGSPGQIGLEPTPDEYVANMVAVFAEVRRVLRDDGTCWLNLGDSYAGSWGNQGRKEGRGTQRPINGPMIQNFDPYPTKTSNTGRIPEDSGLKPKDLIGIPWRVAFALQADGWYLRSDIIWAKGNPMPESVKDRPTKSHEYIFLLSKNRRYYYDHTAIAEPVIKGAAGSTFTNGKTGVNGLGRVSEMPRVEHKTRNRRSVWTVNTSPYKKAHFAVFPPKLIEPCILAGTSEYGACVECSAPWVRVVERETNWQQRKSAGAWKGNIGISSTYQNSVHGHGMSHDLGGSPIRSMHWEPSCSCDAARVPCVVLDPFVGSGTAGMVALQHNRKFIGIDLKAEYLDMAIERINEYDHSTL